MTEVHDLRKLYYDEGKNNKEEKMKKLLIPVVSVLLVCAFIMSGCSAGTTSPTNTTTPPAATTSSPATTASSPTTSAVSQVTPTSTSIPATATTPLPVITSATATTTQPISTETPQSGGILRVICASIPANLGNPTQPMGPPSFQLCAVEPLTRFDANGTLLPQLATSWELDPNAKTITLHLKQGVKFHDNTPFNAQAVIWNYQGAFSTGKIQGSADVKSLQALDDYTVRIIFTRFSALYLISFTHTVLQFSPTAFQTNGSDWAKTHVVGTGPFMQTDYRANSYWKLTKNGNYWGPKPYLDGIEYTVVADTAVANLTMRSGGADLWQQSPVKDSVELEKLGFKYLRTNASVQWLATDSATPGSVFANQKVREALEYALDKPAISKALGFGTWRPLSELAAPDDLPYTTDAVVRNYDPAKAKALLAAAGYPSGIKTKLYTSNAQSSIDLATLMQSYFAAVGITVDIDVCDAARWLSYNGAAGWTGGILSGLNGRNAGFSYIQFSLANTWKIQANSGYQNVAKSQAFSDLYNQLLGVPTLDDSIAIAKKMVNQLNADATVTPLWNSPYSCVAQTWVHTNYLTVHHQIWNAELDWMAKH